MKRPLLLACLLTALFSLHAPAEDALGTSDAELARLKKMNATNQVVALPDAELRKMMVGKWTTGRHEYAFKADGTWRMLPADTSMKGTWKIENHKLIQDTGALTIMQASHKLIVLKNDTGMYPFRYVRIE
ncbi:MAG: hypothetical protein P4L99_17720 [Chthoniobacter sp.]|nr:hypothetical protein [Chthoniobacter sp.]